MNLQSEFGILLPAFHGDVGAGYTCPRLTVAQPWIVFIDLAIAQVAWVWRNRRERFLAWVEGRHRIQ